MDLCTNVLFIEQPGCPGAYHPRISAQFSLSYKALDDDTKFAFNKLYDHFFYHRHNEFWYHSAMKKLPADFGYPMSPVQKIWDDTRLCAPCHAGAVHAQPEVHACPKILTSILETAHYPYLCVCTTGTHDMSTLRGWWKKTVLLPVVFTPFLETRDAPYYCEPSLCLKSERHLQSPAMLCILPWQDCCRYQELTPGRSTPGTHKHTGHVPLLATQRITPEALLKQEASMPH